MTDTTKYELDDSFDSLFADLEDIDIDENAAPAELSTREIISAVSTGALEAATDKNTIKRSAKSITKKALPEGYLVGMDAADDALKAANSLYDKAKEPLQKPIKDLKKAINSKVDDLPDFIPERIKESIRSRTASKAKEAGPAAYDANRSAVDMAMMEVFKIQAGQRKEKNEVALELAKEQSEATLDVAKQSTMMTIANNTGRLVSYQDGIGFRYQQRSLELQHLHYFAARDTLALLQGYAEDTKTNLSALVHNSALPDFKKTQLMEGYQKESMDQLYGKMNESVSGYTDRYFDNFQQKLEKRVMTLAADAGSALSSLAGMAGSADGLEDVTEEMGYEMAGAEGVEFILDKLDPVIAAKIKKLLNKNPEVGKSSRKIMYIIENFPGFFNKTLAEWDGKVFPEALTDRFPFLDGINASIIRDELKTLTAFSEDNELNIRQSLKETATNAAEWDVLSRRTLIEIIPGYLSRMLQLQEQSVTGEKADRQIFSTGTESFTRLGDESKRVTDDMFENTGRQRKRLAKGLIQVLGAGSGVTLSPEAVQALSAELTKSAIRQEAFSVDAVAKMDFGSDSINAEIASLIGGSRGDMTRRNLSGARVFRELAEGQNQQQSRIRELYSTGNSDILRQSGLLGTTEGDSTISMDKAMAMQFGSDDTTRTDIPGVNTPGTGGLLSPQVIKDAFFKPFKDDFAIPVFTPENEVSSQDQFQGLVADGFGNTLQLLMEINDSINEGTTVVAGAPQEGGKPKKKRKKRRWYREVIGSTLTGFGNFTKSYYEGLGTFTEKLAGVGSGIIHGTVDRAFGIGSALTNSDVLVKGRREPALRADLMRAGEYFDAETGKPIKSIKDIKGPVKDSEGNIVLSEVDIDKGIFTSQGANLSGLIGMVKKPIELAFNFQSQAMGLVGQIPGMAKDALDKVINRVRDIYVVGETSPRLFAYLFRNGGYISKSTGKRVYHPDDIDGELLDASGNTVLSLEDISRGLVDRIGTPVGGNRLMQIVKNVKDKALKTAKGVIDTSIAMGNASMSAMGNLAGGIGSMITGGISIGTGEIQNTTTAVEDILIYMRARWPMSGKSAEEDVADQTSVFDQDGDGDRDGSWRDIRGRKEAEEPIVDDEGNPVEPKEKSKGTGLFGMLGGVLTTIASAIPLLISTVSGIGTTIATWLGMKKATDAMGTAADAADALSSGGGKGGKPGLLKRIGSKAWKATKAVGKVGLAVGGAALPYIASAASSIAAGASAVVGGITAAPVIAVAAIGLGAWAVGSYLGKRSRPEPIERLRYLQYGFSDTDPEHLPMLRELEDGIMDEITWSGNEPKFGMKLPDIVQEYAEDWGVDLESPEQTRTWATWFAKRFFPIFMTHARAARVIDNGLDLLDIDDEIDDSRVVEFVKAVTLKSSFRAKGDPYMVLAAPIPGKTMSSNVVLIKAVSAKLIRDYADKASAETAAVVDKEIKKDDKATPSAKKVDPFKTDVVIKAPTPKPEKTAVKRASGLDKTALMAASTPTTKKITLRLPIVGKIISGFGPRVNSSGTRKQHDGVDISAPTGTAAVASESGVVFRRFTGKAFGNCLYIRHDNGMATRYCRLQRFAKNVIVGSEVTKGQVIGYVGSTGEATNSVLHWELRASADQWATALDPLKYTAGNAAKDFKREIADLTKAGKEDAKASDESIEGTESSEKSLIDKAVPSADKKAISDHERKAATKAARERRDLTDADKARKLQSRSTQELSNAIQSSTKENGKAFAQRERLISGQSEMIQLLADMVDLLEKGGALNLGATSGNKGKSKPKSTNAPTRLKPVVDLTN